MPHDHLPPFTPVASPRKIRNSPCVATAALNERTRENTMPSAKVGPTERFACAATPWTGSNSAFMLAIIVITIWAATGPFFHYSDTWQLVINTGTTIITFLMVFLIQRTQNKESMAMQLKI